MIDRGMAGILLRKYKRSLGDGSLPAGSRGRAVVGVWGANPPDARDNDRK